MTETLFIDPTSEPPGRFAPDERGFNVWQGEWEWATRHGPAVVHYLLGKPSRIEGAGTVDGPNDVMTVSPMDHETWRRPRPDGRGWIHGTIEIGADSVTFTDKPRPAPEPVQQGEFPDLRVDLAADARFLDRIGDDLFARAVYDSLCNSEYRKGDDRTRWSCSWRSAGGIVADLRDKGESYIDFYLGEMLDGDGEAVDAETRRETYAEVMSHYMRLGWRIVGPKEAEGDVAAACRQLLDAEALPPGECPDWAEPWKAHDPESVYGRAVLAARSGRLTRRGFKEVTDNTSLNGSVDETDFVAALGGFEVVEAGRPA